ncbi:MAG TPA: LeuA family protein [Vicinamibacterales bacterium]|nr:LeuA family protein [Vicinamibacterales bacterium]
MHPLIYDWNGESKPAALKPRVLLDDETLRDGLQSPSVSAPTIDQKLKILHLMEELGIDTADIGLPGAGPHVVRDVERLAREIAGGMRIQANCAARTVIADIEPIAAISQKVGYPIECCAFIGSSPIRQYAEGWTIEDLQRRTEEAICFAIGEGLRVMYVTEDTTRADPDTLRTLYSTAIRAGASRLCVSDTVGHATPTGAAAVVKFIASVARDCGSDAGIDWHGHRDRDLAVVNTIAAIDAGATRVHGTALGIGERVGNTPMDLLLINLVLMGYLERDLTKLGDYTGAVAESCGVTMPPNYPVLGRDAFRTATGVHAAAVIKAFRKNDPHLADAVYSAIPARLVGREQEIEVGPMSGRSNVIYWLEKRGLKPSEEMVDRIFTRAKASSTVLTEEEIRSLLNADC